MPACRPIPKIIYIEHKTEIHAPSCQHAIRLNPPNYAVIAIAGVGDSTTRCGSGVKSPSPELLFSLGTALALLLALLSLSPVSRAASLVSLCSSNFWNFGARHAGSCQ